MLPRCTAILAIVVHAAAPAATLRAGPDDYRGLLPRLAPGDTLALGPGEYHHGLPLHGLRGTAAAPIRIQGPPPPAVARFVARDGHNTVSIHDVHHVEVHRLMLDGRHAPVDAVKCEGSDVPSHHVTLEGLHIVRHGANQQTVGISTKCPAWDWRIADNTIIAAGTGIYLGEADGSRPFFAGEIVNNIIVDAIGYDLQIKHQLARPGSTDAPTERRQTRIAGNVFAKIVPHPASDGARPNVLLGHWPLRGPGARDRYVVEDNLFFQNPAEALLQAEGRLDIHDNWFYNPAGSAIHLQPHHDAPRDVRFDCNVVVARDTGLALRTALFGPQPRLHLGPNRIHAGRPLVGVPESTASVSGDYASAARALRRVPASIAEVDLAPRDSTGDNPVRAAQMRTACDPARSPASRARTRLAALLTAAGTP
ncbi:MAG: hypothetical protein AB7O21_13285 [Gammaproteobacteria bacterium]